MVKNSFFSLSFSVTKVCNRQTNDLYCQDIINREVINLNICEINDDGERGVNTFFSKYDLIYDTSFCNLFLTTRAHNLQKHGNLSTREASFAKMKNLRLGKLKPSIATKYHNCT